MRRPCWPLGTDAGERCPIVAQGSRDAPPGLLERVERQGKRGGQAIRAGDLAGELEQLPAARRAGHRRPRAW
jgi:hypothetical protein